MRNLFTLLILVTLFGTTFTAVSAQSVHKVHVNAEVVDNIGISAEDVEKGAKDHYQR